VVLVLEVKVDMRVLCISSDGVAERGESAAHFKDELHDPEDGKADVSCAQRLEDHSNCYEAERAKAAERQNHQENGQV
jgi:hypothetical protein